MTLPIDLDLLAKVQAETRRREGRPPAWTVVEMFYDEDRDQVLAEIAAEGADISGQIILNVRYSTRKAWEGVKRPSDERWRSWDCKGGKEGQSILTWRRTFEGVLLPRKESDDEKPAASIERALP